MRPWPQLYDSDNAVRKSILDDAYDVLVVDQMLDAGGGEEILDFNMPLSSAKALLIDNEMVVRITEPGYVGTAAPVSAFVIRTKTEARDNTGNKVLSIHAEALWYDLGAADAKTYSPGSNNPTTAMTAILVGTGWTVGTITVGIAGQTFTLATATNPLAALRAMPGVFGGELWFDNIAKTVNLVTSRGNPNSGLFFAYGKNLASSNRIADTSQLVTRLRPLGAAGLDISLVNGGVTYIEDYTFYDSRSWVRQIKSEVLTNDQINTGAALLTWGQAQLATLNKPKFTYTLDVVVLNTESMPALGDTVRVWDKIIALDTNARVAQRNLNIMEPFRSTLQLNTALYTLANAVGGAVQSTSTSIATMAPDTLVPAAVTGVSATTVDTIDQNGNHTERLLISWTQATLNVDGSAFTDFDHYVLQYVLNGNGVVIPAGAIVVKSIVQALTGIVPGGATFVVSVQAVDHAGNYSVAGTFSGTVVNPNVPPPPPSTPIVDNTSLPLTIRVTWNGLTNAGVAMPSDFRYVEVHASTVNGFTPSINTRQDSLTGSGVVPLVGFAQGVPVYVLLRAVGSTGLSSTSSVVATVAPRLVDTVDIANNIITAAKIAAGQVQTPAIATNAVTTANLTVGGLSDNLIANGLFEENPDASGQINSWTQHWQESGAGGVIGYDNTSSILINGAHCATFVNPGGTVGASMASLATPVQPGEVIAVSGLFRQTTPSSQLYFRVQWGASAGFLQAGALTSTPTSPASDVQVFNATTGATVTGPSVGPAPTAGLNDLVGGYSLPAAVTWFRIEGKVAVPAGALWMRVVLYSWVLASGTSFDSFDKITAVRAIGTAQMQDASIITAKIGTAQINDALIGSVSAGKITVGTLAADITVSARIKTADTGARVEMNSTGIKAFDLSNRSTFSLNSADGSATFSGAITGSSFQTLPNGIFGGGNIRLDNTIRVTIKFWGTNATSPTDEAYAAGISAEDDALRAGYSNILILASQGPSSIPFIQVRYNEINIRARVALLVPANINLLDNVVISGALTTPTINGATIGTATTSNFYADDTNIALRATSAAGSVSVVYAGTATYRPILASAFTVSSARASKDNIATLDGTYGMQLIRKMNPVKFNSKNWADNRLRVSFVADEMNAILPEVCGQDDKGVLVGIDLGAITPTLVKAVQELDARITKAGF